MPSEFPLLTAAMAQRFIAGADDEVYWPTKEETAALQAMASSKVLCVDAERLPWRCFHCDEVFADAEGAALHFGKSLLDQAACLLDEGGLKALRDAEAELNRYRDEDSDVDRQFSALKSKHQTELAREEEKGYAKGLKDANYEGERMRLMEEALRLTEHELSIYASAELQAFSNIASEDINTALQRAREALAAMGRGGEKS